VSASSSRRPLSNLAFEWFIQGDANRNAPVDVTFRKKGRRVR
jgi:hypothetical protein